MTVGKTIRQARIDAGVSQRGLARLTGISYTSVYYYETDRNEPSVSRFVHLMEVLGCTPSQAWARYEAQQQPDQEPDYGTVEDGLGSVWAKCGPDCSLEVVRPGKCQCDYDGANCPNKDAYEAWKQTQTPPTKEEE